MLRRLGIRAKVLAVLAVPMLVVLLAGAFISAETLRDLRDARTARDLVGLVTLYAPLSDALNDERVAALGGAPAEDLTSTRQQTDAALAGFQKAAADIDLRTYPATLTTQLDEVDRQLSEDLPKMRTNVDNGVMLGVSTGYASLASTELTFFDLVAEHLSNRELAAYLAAYVDVTRTADSLVEEYVAGTALKARTDSSATAGQAYTTIANQTEVLRTTARAEVDALRIGSLALPTRDPSVAFTTIRSILGTGSVTQIEAVSTQTYGNAYESQMQSFGSVSSGVLNQADAVAAHAITAAEQRTVLTIAIAIAAAAASLALALLVSRAIVIPLRRLTAAAADVRDELPRLVEQVQVPGEGPQMALPQIPVTTQDEVGRLAAAFNAVNSTTIQVAQEQAALRGSIAEMFVNVARRDQVLLNRQLSFIDSLERTEEDPQALANLFRLDHLATRMRRNAESLLVLAGIDSGRRLRDTLPLSDVVRTASSEIEQYDRIQLDLHADPNMLGFNALPAAHLLAELLENATVFSEPETPVVVTTAVSGPFVEVRIVDQGLGMTDAELATANEKIVSTSASDALGAQRLGLFVVGRLAQRLSAEVVLRKSQRGATGTETIVRFPATLFQSTEASPLGVYGRTAAGPSAGPDAPEVDEVDLAALTDGVTEQGLPRRRAGDVSSGPLPLPSGLPVRPRAGHEADSIVLPEVTPATLPDDLSAPAWSPLVVPSQSSGLPNRTPVAGPGRGDSGAARPAAPADPAARAGLFAGFRGRDSLAAGVGVGADAPAGAPGADDATGVPAADEATGPAAPDGVAGTPLVDEVVAGEVAPEAPAFVVPGLMPDDDTAWTAPDASGPAAPDAWTPAGAVPVGTAPVEVPSDEVAADAAPLAPTWPTWAAAPEWTAPADGGYVPAAFQPEPPADVAPLHDAAWRAPVEAGPVDVVPAGEAPATAPAPEPPAEAAPEPWNAPAPEPWRPAAPEPWTSPALGPWTSPAAEPEPWNAPAAEPWVAPQESAWTAPEADVSQWPVADQPAPTFDAEPDAFAGLAQWPVPAPPAEPEISPYAPFGRSQDEALTWATGAIPVVPEPAGAAEAPHEDAAAGSDEDTAAENVGTTDSAQTPAAPAAPAAPAPWQPPAWATQAWQVPVDDQFTVPMLEPDDAPSWQVDGQAETTVMEPVTDDSAAVPEVAEEAAAAGPASAPAAPGLAATEPAPAEPEPATAVPAPTELEPTPGFATAKPASAEPEPAGPVAPGWAPAVAAATPAESFADLVRGDAPATKHRRWPFGRKRQAAEVPAPLGPVRSDPVRPNPEPAAPPAAPVRASAWAPASLPPVPQVPEPAPVPVSEPAPEPPATGWAPQAGWNPPAPAVPAEPVPTAPTASTWSPPEWAPRPASFTDAEQPAMATTPAADTRIGTLDDEVAAMLALRSDIQEQALSELSQLSAYRPQVVHGADRLTRRVPTAVPEAPEIVESTAERDPEEIRARLASFQSGTARGRRDAGQDGATP